MKTAYIFTILIKYFYPKTKIILLAMIIGFMGITYASNNSTSQQIVQQFLHYFNSIQNFKIYFQQNPIKSTKQTIKNTEQGIFWMNKPGKLRLAYNNEKIPLLILNDKRLTVVQRDMHSIYYLPAKKNIWAFLLKKKITLPKDMITHGELIHPSHTTSFYKITFQWNHQSVIFITQTQFHIQKIYYKNLSGQTILLNIQRIQTDIPMNIQKLFYFNKPKDWVTLNSHR